jgi:hypothetical protein
MGLEELKKKFSEQVKLRAFDDKYVDRGEEKEILQFAVQEGVSIESARSALKQICENEGYALESSIQEQLKDMIETFAGNDGKIDEKEFNDAVTIAKKKTLGTKTDKECKKMVIELIEADGSKIKTGMFSNWLKRVKKEVGMA